MKALLALLVAASLTGCFKMTFQLQAPGAPPAISNEYDNHFHWSLLGIIQISPRVDLSKACPGQAPAAIYERVGILGGLINTVLAYYVPILSVHQASLYCSAGGAPAAPPAGEPPAGTPPAT
jgi:hypothetical protein